MGATGKVLQLGTKAAIEGGQQFFKRMRKAKILPKLSGIVTDDLTKHIDTVKSADEITNIETMFKGMKNGDDASYDAFDEFTSTKMVANQYQQNYNALETQYRKAVEPKESIESTLFGDPDAKPITSDELTELGNQIQSKGITAPQGLEKRGQEISSLVDKGLIERGPQNKFEAIFFGSKEFTDEKDVNRIIRRFRSSTLDDIGLGRTDIAKNRKRDRGLKGVRVDREGKLTLGEDQGFYAGTPEGSHAHHWTPLAVLDKVVDGMSPKQVETFLKYMEKDLGIFGGNHIGNLRQLPSNIHNMLHRRLDALGYNPQTLKSFAGSTLAQRKAFMKKMKADFDKLEEEIFTEMMVRKGNQAGPQLK